MSIRFQAPRGTRDLLPRDAALWAGIEATARSVFAASGYGEIRTPILEETELFAKGVGESSDIVGKEMYSFPDKSGRSLTLRPENTAGVCRAFIENGMSQYPKPVRLFYIGPQFRYEKPQKGRYRQFHQIGAEYFGSRDPEADVEVLAMLFRFVQRLGLERFSIAINTVGDSDSRSAYRTKLVEYLEPRRGDLSEESQRRLETNPLRILDSKSSKDRHVLAGAPSLADSLNAESKWHFNAVCSFLAALKIPFQVEPRLVRGLDYYTHTVFELTSSSLGAQDAFCGGGAYEDLVARLGGPPTYGVGFAVGLERIASLVPESMAKKLIGTGPLRVSAVGSASRRGEDRQIRAQFLVALETLRSKGIHVVERKRLFPGNPFAAAILGDTSDLEVILGDDELATETICIREVSTGEKHVLSYQDALDFIHSKHDKEDG